MAGLSNWLKFLVFKEEDPNPKNWIIWKTTVKRKWRLIWKVMMTNIVVVPLIAVISYMFLGEKINPQSSYPGFFGPWREFFLFFSSSVFATAMLEEGYYRSSAWITSNLFYYFFKNKSVFVKSMVLWLAIVGPTVYWAFVFHPVAPPVFFAGLTWGWLTVKTRSIWPAMFCHGLSNALIYFLIKILNLIDPSLIQNL